MDPLQTQHCNFGKSVYKQLEQSQMPSTTSQLLFPKSLTWHQCVRAAAAAAPCLSDNQPPAERQRAQEIQRAWYALASVRTTPSRMCLVSKGSGFILFSGQIIWGFEGRWPLGLPAQQRMTSRTTTTVSETPWYKVFLLLPPLPHIMLIQWGAVNFFFKIPPTTSASGKALIFFRCLNCAS